MLKHHQAEALVAAMAAEAQSTRDPAAPPTGDIGESAPPGGQEEQPAEETPDGASVAEGNTYCVILLINVYLYFYIF